MLIGSLLVSLSMLTGAIESINPSQQFPSWLGASGLNRVYSAIPNPPTTLGIGTAGSFYWGDHFVDDAHTSRSRFRLSGNYTANLGMPLEFFTGIGFSETQNEATNPHRETTTYFDNLDLGIRLSHRMKNKHIFIGAIASTKFLGGPGAPRATAGGTQNMSGPFAQLQLLGLVSADISDLAPLFPFRFHANFGYRSPLGDVQGPAADSEYNRFALDAFKYHQVGFGAGFELLYPYFHPFMEYTGSTTLMTENEAVDFGDNPHRLSTGLRYLPIPSLSILVGGDLAINGPDDQDNVAIARLAPYEFFVGVTFQAPGSDFLKDLKERRAERKKHPGPTAPSAADEWTEDDALYLDPTDPTFTNETDLTSETTIGPTAETVAKQKEATAPLLKSNGLPPPRGRCEGKVLNPEGTPLQAIFVSKDPEIPSFQSDLKTGNFVRTMQDGDHEFEVRVDGYLPKKVICETKPNYVSHIDIQLEKPKHVTVVANKIILPQALYFEFGTANLSDDSLPLIDEVAEILKSNTAFQKLTIDGHTDSIGSAESNQKLSADRAWAVQQALVARAIPEAKLKSQGFGSTQPVGNNETAEGRAENRRVEFNLVFP